jgi:hypothetical protein
MKSNMTDFNSNTVTKRFINKKPKKLELLVKNIESLTESDFTGYVKINYSQGSIGRVEKFEEILKELKTRD